MCYFYQYERISLSILYQIEKSGTLLKSACHRDYETALDFKCEKEWNEIFKVKDKAQNPK